MGTTLNLFPVRVPIGATTDSTGRRLEVLMTPEFARALSDLFTRVGGTNNLSTDELAMLAATDTGDATALAMLQRRVIEQEAQLAVAADLNARLAALERKLEDVARLAHSAGPAPVDWEHPGKVGAATRNSGSFTTVSLNAGTVAKPGLYFGTDTGTGFYRIGANNIGLAISGAKLADYSASLVAITGSLSTTTGATFGAGTASVNVITNGANTGAASGVTNILRVGGTTVMGFGNKSALVGGAYDSTPYIFHVGVLTTSGSMAIGAAMTVTGAFGCNGKTAQGANALGAAATDPASTQALANNIRAALIACGIGS